MVPETASAGVDITATIGFTSKSRTAASRMDTAINRITEFPISRAACFLFFPPMAWPMVTVVPMASPTIITVSICMTWLPTETAVVLATPSN